MPEHDLTLLQPGPQWPFSLRKDTGDTDQVLNMVIGKARHSRPILFRSASVVERRRHSQPLAVVGRLHGALMEMYYIESWLLLFLFHSSLTTDYAANAGTIQ